MSELPMPNSVPDGGPAGPTDRTVEGSENVADLKREVERLRTQLAKTTTEAEMYRRAAYAMLEKIDPYVSPTEEELSDLMHGPRGRSIRDIIAEFEREGGQ